MFVVKARYMATENKVYDTVIIGAGAAGLMTAITCARLGTGVLLLDGKEKVGAKILMSGGTRCNVTNEHVTESDFESEQIKLVRRVLQAFPSERAVQFFEGLGVELSLEPGGKYFPSTNSAKTVLSALLHEAEQKGVALLGDKKVKTVKKEGNDFKIEGDGFSFRAKTVVMTTGGLSHPTTGSDGGGYEMAKHFGHTIIFTTPGLTPLLTDDADWKSLSGLSVPCHLTLWVNGRKHVAFSDPLLFTHFGFSGPVALNISRYWVRLKSSDRVELTAHFLPHLKEEEIDSTFIQAGREHPHWKVKRMLSEDFPDRFLELLFRKMCIPPGLRVNQLKREDRERLVKWLTRCVLPVKDVYGYSKAEVTAGGVDLNEVNVKTMESKLVPGLFFAGEILDADGRIGGFNFQWAWSTGFLAAGGIAKRIARGDTIPAL